ncbi:hypothetical protein MRX96_036570 [Rhipicephalus microplus]
MTLFGLRKVPSCRTQKVLGKRRSGGCHPAMDHIRPSRQDTAPYTRAGHACLRRSSTGRNQNAKVRRSQLGVATPPHQFASCGCRSRSSAAVSRQSTNKQARSNLATVGRAERSAPVGVARCHDVDNRRRSGHRGVLQQSASRLPPARGEAARLRKRRAARLASFELWPRGLQPRVAAPELEQVCAPCADSLLLSRPVVQRACTSSPSRRRCFSWRIKPVGHLGSRR